MTTFDPEFNLAFSLRIKRMILATSDIDAGVEFSASLAYQDITRNNGFAAKLLHAQAFRL